MGQDVLLNRVIKSGRGGPDNHLSKHLKGVTERLCTP